MTHNINAYLNVSVKNDESSEIQFIMWAMNNLEITLYNKEVSWTPTG